MTDGLRSNEQDKGYGLEAALFLCRIWAQWQPQRPELLVRVLPDEGEPAYAGQ